MAPRSKKASARKNLDRWLQRLRPPRTRAIFRSGQEIGRSLEQRLAAAPAVQRAEASAVFVSTRPKPSVPASTAWLAWLLLLCGALCACGDGDLLQQDPSHQPRTGTLRLDPVPAQDVLPGLRLRLAGTGFQPSARATTHLSLSGERNTPGGTQTFELELPTEYVSETSQVIPIDQALFDTLAGGMLSASESVHIQGTLRMELSEDRQTFVRTAPLDVTLRTQLLPIVDRVSPSALFLGDDLVVSGSGFLLEGEGQMILSLTGTFVRQVLPGDRSTMPGSQAALYPRVEHTLVPVSRTEARLPIRARTLGIQPGTLFAQAALENRQVTGDKVAAPVASVTLSLLRTQLSSLDTKVVRRGMRAGASGAGFLPLDLTGDTATAVHLFGTFTLKDGTVVPTDLTLITDVLDSHKLVFVPHPTLDSMGKLTGLGSRAGRFIGTFEPEVLSGANVQHGVPLPCSPQCIVDVGSPLQVLYLKFLANFTEGLRRFGLRNLEPEIRDQVMAVVRRTYADWNVEVRDSLPTDFDEFTTIEIGGPDPNNAGLFGLDNSEALDSGNLRLNDYIGGFNAAADRKGVYGFGGVFIEPFLSLSPRAAMPLPIASPRFDEVFAAFIPEYGGQPAGRSELAPDERRQPALLEAIRVLGALIGGTVAHEFGHSIGMAVVPGGGSHNAGDFDRELMDSGPYRPFEERAELGDYQQRPSGFSMNHRAYLNQILPRD